MPHALLWLRCRLHSLQEDYPIPVGGVVEERKFPSGAKFEVWIADFSLITKNVGPGPFGLAPILRPCDLAVLKQSRQMTPTIKVVLSTLEGERLAYDYMVVPFAGDDDEVAHHQSLPYRVSSSMGWWYATAKTWMRQTWMGVPMGKWAGDLVSYQELLHEIQARVVVELGSCHGGGAMWFASTLMGIAAQKASYPKRSPDYHVLSVDISLGSIFPEVFEHPNIELMEASSVAPQVADRIRCLRAQFRGAFFFILDSAHNSAHVLAELRSLHPLLQRGDVVIVEDTYLGAQKWGEAAPWIPAVPSFQDGGPFAAVEAFLSENGESCAAHCSTIRAHKLCALLFK